MAANEPTRATCRLVDERAGECCERCGKHAEGGSRHHRRSKRVRDEHTHSPSNLVLLCGSGSSDDCHLWVHTHRVEAELAGFWLSQFVTNPAEHPVTVATGPDRTAVVFLDDAGNYIPMEGHL